MCGVCCSLREKHTHTDTHSTYFSPARSLEDHLFFPSMPWGSESHVSSRWTHTHTQDDYEWMSQSGSGKCVWRKRDNARKVCVCVCERDRIPTNNWYNFWYNTVILLVAHTQWHHQIMTSSHKHLKTWSRSHKGVFVCWILMIRIMCRTTESAHVILYPTMQCARLHLLFPVWQITRKNF